MEKLEYRTVDKSTWDAGPWQDEPDKMQFADPVTGLPCLIVRASQGHLCGYVGVSENHPFYKQSPFGLDVRVHGGLNFGKPCAPHADESHGVCHIPGDGEDDAVWWLGFDCGHDMDLCPGLYAKMRSLMPPKMTDYMKDDFYCDISYVKTQIASLALQLSKV